MEWGTLAVAAVGAVFGIGATVVTDALRSRREREQRWADAKRVTYARFLAALAQAHSRMTVAAASGLDGSARVRAVHDAFLNDPQNTDPKAVLREVAITAPDHVHQVAESVYEQLRTARDLLESDAVTFEAPEYQRVIYAFFADLDVLQRLMRSDLQPPADRRS
ncbi:hypothetical protein GCM10010277_54660 [Streptomyces longisporoflavus]|uniref:hypothetical protein n=1 Tax=Streptomyces longisporoflavus TaxID=28044 RepID=UPI00167E4AE8|nr:hypothetical protein [Streptomyces longisporoflavus]GGV55079.1 hypothetical protein GCM10010277_54660 [Streptomyces longisporoflavus]